jgi:hypothetical protein
MSERRPTPSALVDFTYPGGKALSGVMDSAIRGYPREYSLRAGNLGACR